jgi:ferredoxin
MAELLGAEDRHLEGLLGGEVMECVYARSPEGCGNEVHCETCTVRITVMETHATGRAKKGVHAKLARVDGEVDLVISTEKRGDVVLVLIESISPSGESDPIS